MDVLDQPSEGTLPPPGVAVVDVLVDVSTDDTWSAGAIRGLAVNGARLRYAEDPNGGGRLLVNPGVGQRFSTFVCQPRARDGMNRYNNSGASIAGRYCPGGPGAVANKTEINIAYFAFPPATAGSPSADGAVIRIALDMPTSGPLVLRRLDEVQPGDVPFFIADCDGPSIGTVAATYDVPTVTGIDWALVQAAPEPGTAVILWACGAGVLRRGRR